VHGLPRLFPLGRRQCLTGMAGAYQSRKCKRGIVVEAVCDEDLWVWHLFVGAPGSLNDINVMQQSPLYLDVTGGRWPPRGTPFTIKGRTRTLPYYLVDGIYPRYEFLRSPHPKPSTEEQTTFNRLLEAIRQDVERLFGALMERIHVALQPGRYHSVSQLATKFTDICSPQKICVETPRSNVLRRRRRAAGSDGETNCGMGGDAGGGSGGCEGQSGGAPARGTPAAGALAPGGDSAGGVGGSIVAAGAHAPGGGSAGGVGGGIAVAGPPAPVGGVGGVATAMDNVDSVGSAPPALNPAAHPLAAGMAAIFDAWAVTQNVHENERLRPDLTAEIYRDRGELLAPEFGDVMWGVIE